MPWLSCGLRQAQPRPAQRSAEEALKLALHLGNTAEEAEALITLGHAERERGRYPPARDRLSRALSIGNQLGDERLACHALIQLGWTAESEGHPDRALQLLGEALARADRAHDPRQRVFALHRAASAAIELGRLELARQHLAEALRIRPSLTLTARVVATAAGLAAGEGKPERALRLAGAATGSLGLVASGLQPTEQVMLQRRLAPARQALGPQGAASAFAAGQEMSLDQAMAYALQDLLGGEATQQPKGLLSARELEVASLISQALTNAQIAERLVISEGTAKRHVENIMAKLEVHSRAQIVSWLAAHAT